MLTGCGPGMPGRPMEGAFALASTKKRQLVGPGIMPLA